MNNSNSHLTNLTHAALSPLCKYIYACGEDGVLVTWEVATGCTLVRGGGSGVDLKAQPLLKRSCMGLLSHPHRPILVGWGEEGVIMAWS